METPSTSVRQLRQSQCSRVVKDRHTSDTSSLNQFRQPFRSDARTKIRNDENVRGSDLIFEAKSFAEDKPIQLRESSLAAPFRLGGGFRQNPKWALENFHLPPTKMLIAPARSVPANGSDWESVSKVQIERSRRPLHAGVLGRLAGARDIQKKHRQREVKMFQLELKNSTVLLLWRRLLGTSCSIMVPSCRMSVRIMFEAGITYFSTPRRSRQPLIHISFM